MVDAVLRRFPSCAVSAWLGTRPGG